MSKMPAVGEEVEMCACGQPLHYSSESLRRIVEGYIAELGETLNVQFSGVGIYAIPRHFLALHGISAQTAIEMEFEKIA